MNNTAVNKNNNLFLLLIGILSVAVPLLVAFLFYSPVSGQIGDFNVYFLPRLNAVLNTATTACLLAGYYFIRKNNRRYHTTAMVTAFVLSSIFLVSYVIYHSYDVHTLFGDANHDGVISDAEALSVGFLRTVYLFLLLTHIVLAAIIVPFVLLSIYFGWSRQYKNHRKISKWTFPLWLYVAVTGVLVYLMISPYYPV